jgi:hypothetical protein
LCGWLSLCPSAKVRLFILPEVSFVQGCNRVSCHDWPHTGFMFGLTNVLCHFLSLILPHLWAVDLVGCINMTSSPTGCHKRCSCSHNINQRIFSRSLVFVLEYDRIVVTKPIKLFAFLEVSFFAAFPWCKVSKAWS